MKADNLNLRNRQTFDTSTSTIMFVFRQVSTRTLIETSPSWFFSLMAVVLALS